MAWAKIDDGFSEHPKIAALSDAAFRAQVTAICYSARNLTDGHLIPRVVASLTEGNQALVDELVQARVWDRNGDGLVIHDYLDYQSPADEIRARRQEAADRMRDLRSRERSGERAAHVPRSFADPTPIPTPTPKPRPKDLKTLSSTSSPDVRVVYDFWRLERGKTNARYDRISDRREAKLKARLKEFSVEDLCNAIRGVALDPWLERSRHDDLVTIFSNREQVEKFLALYEAGPAPARNPQNLSSRDLLNLAKDLDDRE